MHNSGKAAARHWGVVGGGMMGLTVALRLAQHGDRVTLWEAASHVGGLADAWALGDVTWDRHYHVTLLSDSNLRGLITELGLADDLRWSETKTGFYTDGKLYSLSNSLEFLRFPPLSLVDKLRLGATIFHASRIRDSKSLENIPVADWLRKWSGQRTTQKIWLPLLRAKLGENYDVTSAAFIWAIIARMYAARRTGLKKEMFGYLQGGYARLLAAFAAELSRRGVELRLGQPVAKVERVAAGDFCVTNADGDSEACDRVVVTLPPPLAARACPALSSTEQSALSNVHYQGIVCASLLTKQGLSPYYVTNITEPDCPFTAVIEMTALVDKAEFGGRSLIYLPKYVAPNDPLFVESDESIRERFYAGLARMHPGFRPEQVDAFRLSRVRHVFALPTLNYSNTVAPRRTSVPGLYLVNSAQIINGTLNVNETVGLANAAAADLLSEPAASTPKQLHHQTQHAAAAG